MNIQIEVVFISVLICTSMEQHSAEIKFEVGVPNPTQTPTVCGATKKQNQKQIFDGGFEFRWQKVTPHSQR